MRRTDGKRRQKVIGTRGQAKKAAVKIQSELVECTYARHDNRTWGDFRTEFIATVADGSINKELRDLKAAFRKSVTWEYMLKAPHVEMEREPERIPEFASPDDFAALYAACDEMKRPTDLPCSPAEWWNCLLVFSYLTGWRVGQVLALRCDQIDLDNRTAKAFAEDTKDKRDALVDLHPVVVDHLKAVLSFHELVFFWPHHPRTLWSDFAKLKETAGVKFSGAFHRLRFGFATMNRGRYDGKVLQRRMLHKSYQTTLRYINVETEVARTAEVAGRK